MKRVKGHERIDMFGDFVLYLNSNIELAVADISAALCDQVLLDMSSDKSKASAGELQHKVDSYERRSKKEKYVVRSKENPNDTLITPEMERKIVLGALQKGKRHIDHVRAELEERGVELPMSLEEMK